MCMELSRNSTAWKAGMRLGDRFCQQDGSPAEYDDVLNQIREEVRPLVLYTIKKLEQKSTLSPPSTVTRKLCPESISPLSTGRTNGYSPLSSERGPLTPLFERSERSEKNDGVSPFCSGISEKLEESGMVEETRRAEETLQAEVVAVVAAEAAKVVEEPLPEEQSWLARFACWQRRARERQVSCEPG